MNETDRNRAYGLLDEVEAFLGDIRYALQRLDASDADSVYDTRRDCHIRIQNAEGKLAELKEAVGPDPMARPCVLAEHQVTLPEQKAEDLRHRLLVAENACGDVRTRLEGVDVLSNLPAAWTPAYDDVRKCLVTAVLNIRNVSKALE